MPRDVAAAERKRLRDRVAQQNLRNRRQQYIHDLEEKVKRCEERHGGGEEAEGNSDRDKLWIKIRHLQEENAALKDRHRKLRSVMASMRGLLADDVEDDRQAESSTRRGDSDASKHDKDTPSPQDNLDGSTSQMSVDDDAISIDDQDTIPPRQSRQASLISATPKVHRPASKSTPTGPAYAWQDDGDAGPGISTPVIEGPVLTPFPVDAPLPNSPPETAYSPLMDNRLWNFMDLWTNHNNIEHLLSGEMNAAAATASSAAAPTLASVGARDDGVRKEGLRDEPPAWSVIPMRISTTADRHYQPWDRDMGAILDAADEPSPLELVFGSSTNFLANEVHVTLKHFFAGAAERLSIGIMIYSYVKWRTKPSPERFNRLPEFIRPVPEQAEMPHPGCLDIMFWSRLRANIVKNHDKYDPDRVMRKYCSCVRLRWSRDRDMLIPREDCDAGVGEPRETHKLNPEFYARYTDLSNWGLTAEFQRVYPELLEGMDWESICIVDT